MVQKYSIFAAIQANDVMRNAYLINLVRVLCGLPVSGDSTELLCFVGYIEQTIIRVLVCSVSLHMNSALAVLFIPAFCSSLVAM